MTDLPPAPWGDHDLTDDESWCWFHMKLETGLSADGAFVCGECFHIYPADPGTDFCEVCLHDF